MVISIDFLISVTDSNMFFSTIAGALPSSDATLLSLELLLSSAVRSFTLCSISFTAETSTREGDLGVGVGIGVGVTVSVTVAFVSETATFCIKESVVLPNTLFSTLLMSSGIGFVRMGECAIVSVDGVL